MASNVDLKITKINDVYVHIDCEDGIARELREYFTFAVPNYMFMPAYKNGTWDGKIYLFGYDHNIYIGLIDKITEFANNYRYTFNVDTQILNRNYQDETEWLKGLQLHYDKTPIEPYYYQIEAFNEGIAWPRATFECPTGSGKSLMIYAWIRWFLSKVTRKILLIVPSQTLVEQMYSDFEHYSYANGWDTFQHCYRQYAGQPKEFEKPVWITTWQSIYKQPKKFFDQFEVCIGDEAHGATANSLKGILEKLISCPVKIGTTGTTQDSLTHKLVLEGLFGPIHKVIKTKQLMDEGYLAKLKIKCVLIKHKPEVCKAISKLKYKEEIDFLMQYNKRNNFIKKLSLSLVGNTLILFNYVDTHGKVLHKMIQEESDNPVYIIHGKYGEVKAKEREVIRKQIENETNSILVASYGVFSTGINIKNLQNLIFAHPFKSQIRNLQSIGRVLRLDNKDNSATLFDIADDCSRGKKNNFTLKHWLKRMETYNEQDFDYDVTNITF